MNVAYEFSKVKDAFAKARRDMAFLSEKITQGYDDFMSKHKELAMQVDDLSHKVASQIRHIRHEGFSPNSEKEFHDITLEIKELRRELEHTQNEHSKVVSIVDTLKKASPKASGDELKEVKQRLHSSELELYLLKERMTEKDVEIKQIRDVTSRLFDIVDQLAKAEQHMLGLKK